MSLKWKCRGTETKVKQKKGGGNKGRWGKEENKKKVRRETLKGKLKQETKAFKKDKRRRKTQERMSDQDRVTYHDTLTERTNKRETENKKPTSSPSPPQKKTAALWSRITRLLYWANHSSVCLLAPLVRSLARSITPHSLLSSRKSE